jgi:hypothetical protein
MSKSIAGEFTRGKLKAVIYSDGQVSLYEQTGHKSWQACGSLQFADIDNACVSVHNDLEIPLEEIVANTRLGSVNLPAAHALYLEVFRSNEFTSRQLIQANIWSIRNAIGADVCSPEQAAAALKAADLDADVAIENLRNPKPTIPAPAAEELTMEDGLQLIATVNDEGSDKRADIYRELIGCCHYVVRFTRASAQYRTVTELVFIKNVADTIAMEFFLSRGYVINAILESQQDLMLTAAKPSAPEQRAPGRDPSGYLSRDTHTRLFARYLGNLTLADARAIYDGIERIWQEQNRGNAGSQLRAHDAQQAAIAEAVDHMHAGDLLYIDGILGETDVHFTSEAKPDAGLTVVDSSKWCVDDHPSETGMLGVFRAIKLSNGTMSREWAFCRWNHQPDAQAYADLLNARK